MKRNRGIFSFLIFLLSVSSLFSSTPQIVTYQSQNDFEKGRPKGVSINNYGEMHLAPQIEELFKSDLAFIWAGAADSKGNIYVAGGNTGQVFKIDADKKASMVFEAKEGAVYALAVDKQDNLYVGSSPKGKVYKIPFNKTVSAEEALFFDPEAIYIWSMVFDKQGNLYVGCGEKGRIIKIDKTGNGSVVYESDDNHIRKIIFDQQGNLIAGTSDKGLVVKINPNGDSFVLYDSPLVEITSLAVDKSGNVYAAASGESRVKSTPQRPESASSETKGEEQQEDDEEVDLTMQQITVPSSSRLAKKNSAVYRINTDGTINTFWTSQPEQIYALVFDKDNNIILATGEKGRLYSMTPDGEHTLLTGLDEMQITVLGKDSQNRIFLGTSNTGSVYRLNEHFNSDGQFISEVVDAEITSQWGSITWEADLKENTDLFFYSRSGNTEEPDKSWSPWSESYTVATGQPITSPPARFLQMKAEFSSKEGKYSPVLKQFSFSYLQKNIAPQISQITLLPPGDYYPEASNGSSDSNFGEGSSSGQNGFQSHSYGRKSYRKGFQSVTWNATDENNDNVSFNIYYKGVNENNWRSLVKDFKGVVYSWDSELLPDGRYLLKIVAKDDLSNPPAMTLSSEKVSQSFIVDNTGPKVSEITLQVTGNQSVLLFSVEDQYSTISSVEYGLDAENWKLLYPVDGICDSKLEKFEIKMDALDKGLHTIVIKATDTLKNIGFGKRNIKI